MTSLLDPSRNLILMLPFDLTMCLLMSMLLGVPGADLLRGVPEMPILRQWTLYLTFEVATITKLSRHL